MAAVLEVSKVPQLLIFAVGLKVGPVSPQLVGFVDTVGKVFIVGSVGTEIAQNGSCIKRNVTSIPFKQLLNEPRYEKTGFLHMRKQRRRSASR